ncbi:MAG: hypothetical protein AAF597_14215 [Bacteroidota bacterium]
MEVKVKIDKFGRILIPKKIREAKGYEYGMELSLVMEPETNEVVLSPVNEEPQPYWEMAPWGLPIIRYPDPNHKSMDAVAMIAEDREERSLITSSGYFDYNPKAEEE